MSKMIQFLIILSVLIGLSSCNSGNKKNDQSETTKKAIKVTEANFTIAETDKYMSEHVKEHPVNTLRHSREMSSIDNQFVIRENQDIMYSHAVVDISEGATLINPAWDVYSSIQVIDENQYTIAVVYSGDSVTITKKMVALGDHVFLNIRTGVRTLDEKGYKESHQHQDNYEIKANSAKPYISKGFEQKTLDETRKRLIGRMSEATQPKYYFGTKDEVDSLNFLIASAGGWAGLPIKDATYINIEPGGEAKSGKCSSITIPVPPLQFDKGAFFSITTYDRQGWIVKENFALNNIQAEANKDGTYTFHFNCPDKINNIDVVDDWTMIIRLYIPNNDEEILEYIKKVNETIKMEWTKNNL
jgi:hypothetical protein